MAEPNDIEALDDAVEALMTGSNASSPRLDPRLAALLGIAADLRDLPRESFRARLKAQLLAGASPAGGKPLLTEEDIRLRLQALSGEPKLVAHDLQAALSDLPEMSMRFLAPLNRCTIGVSRFSQPAHWERHPAGDEMLHVLEGEADVVTLTDDGPVRSLVRAGSIFICPRGLWHRVTPRSPVSLLFATPGEGTEHSSAKQPRRRRQDWVQGRPSLEAHELGAALRGLPELAITPSTSEEEADAAVRTIAALDACTIGVMRYSGLTPWERHPDGDELLHPLEGAVDVTVLTDDGRAEVTVHAGSVFICPRGLWHRQRARPGVTMLFGTPAERTEVSWAEDPRQ